jgi:hypothetical protein
MRKDGKRSSSIMCTAIVPQDRRSGPPGAPTVLDVVLARFRFVIDPPSP